MSSVFLRGTCPADVLVTEGNVVTGTRGCGWGHLCGLCVAWDTALPATELQKCLVTTR